MTHEADDQLPYKPLSHQGNDLKGEFRGKLLHFLKVVVLHFLVTA